MATEQEKKPVKKAPAKKAPAKKAAPKKEAAPKEEAPKKETKKAKKPEVAEPVKPTATEATAFVRDVRVAPRKVRLVADLVRGKTVAQALDILASINKAAVTPVEKLIRSAAANAVNNFHMDETKLYIAEIQVNDGMKIKRYIPRAKGSASGIIKRNANVRIKLKETK